MPLTGWGSRVFIAGGGVHPLPMTNFYVPFNQPARYRISGITKDSTGAVLGACNVDVFETGSRRLVIDTVSDANGNYSVDVTSSEAGLTFFVQAYKAGAPDVAGTSVNTLVGV